MGSALAIVLALVLTCAPAATTASTIEPGVDESRAGMCEHFDGLPYVFCVAMCEARECDRQAPGDDRCEILAQGFASVTNGAAPPCASGSRPSTI